MSTKNPQQNNTNTCKDAKKYIKAFNLTEKIAKLHVFENLLFEKKHPFTGGFLMFPQSKFVM